LYGKRYYFEGIIKLSIDIYSKEPKKPSYLRPTKKNIDNMVKAVLDGLDGKAFKDLGKYASYMLVIIIVMNQGLR